MQDMVPLISSTLAWGTPNLSMDPFHMAGTLAGTALTLNGVVTGGGTYTEGGFSLPYTIEGTMTGTLNKNVVTAE